MEIIPQTLKQRAIAAYDQAQERRRQEEVEREAQAKRAHEELLRTLCTNVLQMGVFVPIVKWLPESGFCWPFAEVDGLLFTCPPDRERLELCACVSASTVYQNGTHVENIEHLGKILSDRYYTPCRIEGNRIVPAHQSAGGTVRQ